MLVKSNQELHERIVDHDAQITNLESANDVKQGRIDKLEGVSTLWSHEGGCGELLTVCLWDDNFNKKFSLAYLICLSKRFEDDYALSMRNVSAVDEE